MLDRYVNYNVHFHCSQPVLAFFLSGRRFLGGYQVGLSMTLFTGAPCSSVTFAFNLFTAQFKQMFLVAIVFTTYIV